MNRTISLIRYARVDEKAGGEAPLCSPSKAESNPM